MVLCRIRNPHGRHGEWDGPWGDASSEWTPRRRQIVGYDPQGAADGVFCMAMEDARRVFEDWDVTYLYPRTFFHALLRGEWTAATAGGPRRRGYARRSQSRDNGRLWEHGAG